jgi:hypothetical protein
MKTQNQKDTTVSDIKSAGQKADTKQKGTFADDEVKPSARDMKKSLPTKK